MYTTTINDNLVATADRLRTTPGLEAALIAANYERGRQLLEQLSDVLNPEAGPAVRKQYRTVGQERLVLFNDTTVRLFTARTRIPALRGRSFDLVILDRELAHLATDYAVRLTLIVSRGETLIL